MTDIHGTPLKIKYGKAQLLARMFHCHRNTITNAMRGKSGTPIEQAIRDKAISLGYIKEHSD